MDEDQTKLQEEAKENSSVDSGQSINYSKEVKERWGDTEAYKQSIERTSKLTDDEIDEIRKNGEKLTQEIADNMNKGVESPEVQALITKHHKGVNAFYDCDLEMYKKLGQNYLDDARLTAYYERFSPGMAEFMRDAINYYCDHNK